MRHQRVREQEHHRAHSPATHQLAGFLKGPVPRDGVTSIPTHDDLVPEAHKARCPYT